MVEQTSQTDRAELSSSEEKGLLDRVKKLLSPLKSDRWFAVAVYGSLATVGLAIGTLAWNWSDLQTNPSEQSKRKFDASLSVVSTGATIVTGGVLFLNLIVAKAKLDQETAKAKQDADLAQQKLEQDREKAERDERLAQSRLTMERFSKAVEMLGSKDSIHLRLGGIYALESIAADSDKDTPDENYRQVLEVLTAFVRENAPYPPKEQAKHAETHATLTGQLPGEQSTEAGENTKEELPPLPTDIQAVLTVLKRRNHRDKDWEQYPLDLRKTDLRRADLRKANLQQANLWRANLQQADLRGANLQQTNLREANLQQADLSSAELQGAHLWEAELQQAKLGGAKLQQADLGGAKLQGAYLRYASLKEADLRGAKLQGAYLERAGLTGVSFWNSDLLETELAVAKHEARANLQSAQNWESARYDPEIREWLGLPPETLEAE